MCGGKITTDLLPHRLATDRVPSAGASKAGASGKGLSSDPDATFLSSSFGLLRGWTDVGRGNGTMYAAKLFTWLS